MNKIGCPVGAADFIVIVVVQTNAGCKIGSNSIKLHSIGNEVCMMNMNNPKVRRMVAILVLLVVVAMLATMIVPYLL